MGNIKNRGEWMHQEWIPGFTIRPRYEYRIPWDNMIVKAIKTQTPALADGVL